MSGAAFWLAIAVLALAAMGGAAPVGAESGKPVALRCGWFDKPTPGNAYLHDKDGDWTIGEQGGRQAAGDWPTFSPSQWLPKGNGSYGIGCACLRVEFDPEEKDILAILSSFARPLSQCRRDPTLKGIERGLR